MVLYVQINKEGSNIMNVFKISVAETGMFKHYPLKAQNELDAIKKYINHNI